MKSILAFSILIALVFVLSNFSEDAAALEGNQAYLVEGAGFAVTDESIKNSQLDLLIATQNKVGSRTPISIEDGFVTLNNLDFDASNLSGNLIMNGRFLVITGTAIDTLGNSVRVSFTGKLIQNSDEGSVYSFTGRISQGAEINKIIYTTKISGLSAVLPSTSDTPTGITTMKEKEILIRITKGSSQQGFGVGYIDSSDIRTQMQLFETADPATARYFSPDRLTITPGTTLTFVNNDSVSHSVNTGKRDTKRGIGEPIPDGIIASGDIAPGQTWSVKIDKVGFIFLFDKDYPWMTMDIVSFPDVKQDVIRRTGQNQAGN